MNRYPDSTSFVAGMVMLSRGGARSDLDRYCQSACAVRARFESTHANRRLPLNFMVPVRCWSVGSEENVYHHESLETAWESGTRAAHVSFRDASHSGVHGIRFASEIGCYLGRHYHEHHDSIRGDIGHLL